MFVAKKAARLTSAAVDSEEERHEKILTAEFAKPAQSSHQQQSSPHSALFLAAFAGLSALCGLKLLLGIVGE